MLPRPGQCLATASGELGHHSHGPGSHLDTWWYSWHSQFYPSSSSIPDFKQLPGDILRSFHPEILPSFHRRIHLTPGTFCLSSDVIQKIIGGCYILNKLWTTKRGIKGRRIEEKRGRLAGEHGKAFSLITVGLKEGRYKTSLGPHCKQPVCLDKKFRIYPKCHDFQQESTSTVTATKRHWSPGVKTILRGQRLKGQGQEDHLHQDRTKSALLISMPLLLSR